MANILSNDEVDALIGAVQRGEVPDSETETVDANRAPVFNFRRPSQISREQLRIFSTLSEGLVSDIKQKLSMFLRTNVEVNLSSIDQMLYKEFFSSISEVTYCMIYGLDPLPGKVITELNPSLVASALDVLLGGDGDGGQAGSELTEIEFAVFEPLTKIIIDQIVNSWRSVFEVSCTDLQRETDSAVINIAPMDAMLISVTMSLKIGKGEGMLNLCYPMPMVQKLMGSFELSSAVSDNYYGKAQALNFRKQILNNLSKMKMPVSVSLGSLDLNSQDLVNLEKGDVLILNSKIDDPVNIKIGNKPFFHGRPGKKNSRMAVKILGHSQEKSNFLDIFFEDEDNVNPNANEVQNG